MRNAGCKFALHRAIRKYGVANFEVLLLTRASAILLCILTELQAFFRFDGARINERLHEVWNALMPAPEVKDLYDSRYAELMKRSGIEP